MAWPPAAARTGVRARPTAGALAALVLAGQLAALLHLVLVPHALTGDGSLVHPGAPEASAARAHAAAAPGAARVEPPVHDGHDHECPLAATLRAQAREVRGRGDVLQAPPAQGARSQVAEARPASGPGVLHPLAPKQSPPVHG